MDIYAAAAGRVMAQMERGTRLLYRISRVCTDRAAKQEDPAGMIFIKSIYCMMNERRRFFGVIVEW